METFRHLVLKYECTLESTKGAFSKYKLLDPAQNTPTQLVCDGPNAQPKNVHY